ncbi:MAG: hypothetical protein HDR82_09905 [Bacteroides sp.]|nr:hypothetical protein [Bacteroides sp.]
MTKEKNDMTNEHNFKVGDRVRLKGDYAFVGTIVDVGLYSADIIWDCEPNEIYLQAFDCIEHIDRRTAFLTRLQSLLREFEATLVAHKTDMPVSVYFKDNEAPSASIGKEINKGCGVVVTADNIMDFDKE